MRYPVDDFKTRWNTTAGFGFGDKTDYGSHEAVDLNTNAGGNADLGESLYAIAKGTVTSIHSHTTKPSFGKHLHIKIVGPWGERWVHYAHCNEIFVTEGQEVNEGDRIATVGNSGTVYAHCHLALKNTPTGVDGIAKTLEDLKKWEDPILFIEKWMGASTEEMIPVPRSQLEDFQRVKDGWNKVREKLNVEDSVTVVLGEIEKLVKYEDVVVQKDKSIQDAQKEIGELKLQLGIYQDENTKLASEASVLTEKATELEKKYTQSTQNYEEALRKIHILEGTIINPSRGLQKIWEGFQELFRR